MIGNVAGKLEISKELAVDHPVSNIPMLKLCLGDTSHIISTENVGTNDNFFWGGPD